MQVKFLIIGEISFIIFVMVNTWLLLIISFIFALMIVILTFFSGVMLSWQTIIPGLPSMVFFGYSLLFRQGAVFRHYGGICQKCKKKLKMDDFHVHHVIPHKLGGKTTLGNALLLCPDCHHREESHHTSNS